jgi:hypothetical protein
VTKSLSIFLAFALALVGQLPTASAQATQVGTATPSSAVLFRDVRVFDGKRGQRSGPMHVLVRGQNIERISSATGGCSRFGHRRQR